MRNFIKILVWMAPVLFLGSTSCAGHNDKLIVLVLDTGYTASDTYTNTCSVAALDYTGLNNTEDSSPVKHGSNIAGLISKHGGNKGYCITNIKVFKQVNGKTVLDIVAYINALKFAQRLKPAIINLSMAGYKYLVPGESQLIKSLLDAGVTVVAAAGNDNFDLDFMGCLIYPACIDPRIYVVGNVAASRSNIGSPVDVIVNGQSQTAGGVTLSGTSQSAAIFTGMLIKKTVELKSKFGGN